MCIAKCYLNAIFLLFDIMTNDHYVLKNTLKSRQETSVYLQTMDKVHRHAKI
jgi:hypothetical protein